MKKISAVLLLAVCLPSLAHSQSTNFNGIWIGDWNESGTLSSSGCLYSTFGLLSITLVQTNNAIGGAGFMTDLFCHSGCTFDGYVDAVVAAEGTNSGKKMTLNLPWTIIDGACAGDVGG